MLHFPTILLFTLTLLLAVSAVFALMERLYPRRPGIRYWLVGCLLLSAGYALRLIDSLENAGPPFWWAGLCFLGGNLAIWLGILRFCRLTHRLPSRWFAPTFLLVWALAAALPASQQLATNLVLGGLTCGFAGSALLQARELEGRLMRWSVAGVYLVSAVVLIVRGLLIGAEVGTLLGLKVEEVSAIGAPLSTPLIIMRCFALLVLLHAAQERLLRGLATTDVLTGLLNRQGFLEHASRLLARPTEKGTACVLMLDLDFFKQVNDRYGHAAGDTVLRRFSKVLRHQLRPDDCIGRLGGEEVAALLVGVSTQEARAIAERVCQAWRTELVRIGDQTIRCSVSVGVGSGGGSLEARLAQADAGLYRAKAAGRDQVADASGC